MPDVQEAALRRHGEPAQAEGLESMADEGVDEPHTNGNRNCSRLNAEGDHRCLCALKAGLGGDVDGLVLI